MLQITEDTPPDMLAGAMDLTVHLPTGRSVKMSVERSTPMMDLLVQITTNYHLQLSGYTLQALGMAPSKDHSDSILPYKPNTPIGALDTQHIRVIPKSRSVSVPKNVPPGHQPFESTFRLKVHLPRNQLFVTRVSQSVHLEDIMKKVCEEKNLDPIKYEFRHPGNLDEILDPKLTLSDYAITEIYLVQKGSLNQTFSSGDIMSLRKEEERRQMHNKTGGGVFNLIFRRGKSSTGSLSSENRSISPTHSDDSRSVTPPGVQQTIITPPEPDKPKPPQRKRRPAPKPPVEKKTTTTESSLTICHSRNSSDSSGYHEASILSDNNTPLPRRPKSTVISEDTQKTLLSQQHSQSTSNLSKLAAHSKSTSSLAFPSRKKKSAPPPPPPVLKTDKTQPNLEEPSPVVASQPCTVAQTESIASTQPFDSLASAQSLPPPPIEEKSKEVETDPPKQEKIQDPPSPPKEKSEDLPSPSKDHPPAPPPSIDTDTKEPELEPDWQYQLPSPPKAFRDSSPVPESTIVDSVVTSPELFEKLKVIKDHQSETVSDITSVVSEEEKPILNKLSLENLEKRKSLVYNRELATSLKMQDDTDNKKKDTFSNSLINFEKTYDEVKRSSPKEVITTSTLPNFKITTYNNPKKKIDIFEDDTIRSGSRNLQKSEIGRSMENISFRKNSTDEEYKFYKPPTSTRPQMNVFRSESFTREQPYVPMRPVARSKSQLVLNKSTKNVTQINDENLTKSNSLFDVSGLQSLGVIKSIQNKLNTPSNSTEELDKEETSYQKQPEIKTEVQKPVTYQYKPPAINMSTWSERPKIPVNVKEDPDYKFGSKLIVSTVNNDVKSHNSVEIKQSNGVSVRVGGNPDHNKNVSIKVNGAEPVTQTIIKIGGTNSNTRPVIRRPLSNINSEHQRPHSIAFGSDFDISRVPVVRSVEFKKPYKEYQNTSVTQIYQHNNNNNNNNNNSWDRNGSSKPPVEAPKPVFRVNSYLQNNSTPVVRGFNQQPNSFSTLPSKPGKNFALSAPVPFSQANLRRTESIEKRKVVVLPPAPIMPKTNFGTVQSKQSRDNRGSSGGGGGGGDPKEQLLQAIRDFGGKKGLRAVKA